MGLRDRAILEVMYATGLRASELTGLTLEGVDLELGVVRVLREGAARSGWCPSGREARRWVKRYLAEARAGFAARAARARLFLSQPGRPAVAAWASGASCGATPSRPGSRGS